RVIILKVPTTRSTTLGRACNSEQFHRSKNRYFFTPTQVTIKRGQRIILSNLVDQNFTFMSIPEVGLHVRTFKDWSQDLEFRANGIYIFSCVQFPDKKFTVTVQGT